MASRNLDDIKKNKIQKVDKETALIPILNGLYATGRFSTDECEEIGKSIVSYLNEDNMIIVKLN